MADWDVTLGGQNFMLVPGGYRAIGGSAREDGRAGRQRVDDFSGGPGASALHGGLFGTAAVGGWPAPWPIGAAAVGPGPARQTSAGAVGTASPKLTVNDDNYLFVAAGTALHRWPGSGSPASRGTLAGAAVDLARRGGELFFAYAGAADVSRFVDATGTHTTSVLGAGYKAWRVEASGDLVVTVDDAARNTLRIWNSILTVSTSYPLQGEVRRMAIHDNALLVATNRGLYALRGVTYTMASLELWSILSDGLQSSDDYAWLLSFQGRLMTWVGGRVVVYDPGRGWWKPAGLEGAATTGAAVVGGWLFVSVTPHAGVADQLWGYDGAGWWLLGSGPLYPSAAGGGKLAAFESGSGTLFYYEVGELLDGDELISPFVIESGLFDDGLPEHAKRWTRIGVELARPDGQPVGSWSFKLEYSADAGASWITAGTTAVTGELESVQHAIDSTANALRLRVTGTRSSGLPPFITALWAEYAVLDGSRRTRRWELKVHAANHGIDRAGAADPRTAQQIRQTIWDLYTNAATLTFRDVDYGATAVERQVRLIELRESWRQPADQASLGADTVLELTLQEV